MLLNNKNLLKEYFLKDYEKFQSIRKKLENKNNILEKDEEKYLLHLFTNFKCSIFLDLILEEQIFDIFLNDIENIKIINKTLLKYNEKEKQRENKKNKMNFDESNEKKSEAELEADEEELEDDEEELEEDEEELEDVEKINNKLKVDIKNITKNEIKKYRKLYNKYFFMIYAEDSKKIKRISYENKIKLLNEDIKKIKEIRIKFLNILEKKDKNFTYEKYIEELENNVNKYFIKLNPSIKYFNLLLEIAKNNLNNNKILNEKYINTIKWKINMLKEILNIIVLYNEKLVIKYVVLYKSNIGNGLEFNDLKHEGMLGLIKSVYKFNPYTNLKLSTYVSWWIKQKIIQCISHYKNNIKVPLYYYKKIQNFEKLKEKYEQIEDEKGYNINLSDEEIAKKHGMSLKKIKMFKFLLNQTNELRINNSPENENNDNKSYSMEDKISINNEETILQKMENEQLLSIIEDAINNKKILTPTEEFVIKKRFENFNDYNMEETFQSIGSKLNLTKERIRQIENNALKKIKNYLEDYFNIEEN